MTRTETYRRSAQHATEQRIDTLKDKLMALTDLHREVQEKSAKLAEAPEDLSAAILPLAEAMATLTEETKQTLHLVVKKSKEGHNAAVTAVRRSTAEASKASAALESRLRRLEEVAERLEPVTAEPPAPQPNPWPPALVAGGMAMAAVAALAWKAGVL